MHLFLFVFLFFSFQYFAQQKGGRWMFENNGNDEATWDLVSNDGSLTGSAFFSDTEPVVQGNYYLSLEDSANYGGITVIDQEELDFLDEDFAASLWVYPIIGYDNPQHLFMKGDRSGAVKVNNYSIRINNEYFEFIVHAESGAKKVVESSFRAINNRWNFIAVYYNYTQSKLYFWNDPQGAPIDTLSFNAPLFPNNNKLYIGTSGENGFKRFWGRIDDLRISNKISDILDYTTNIEFKDNLSNQITFSLNQNYPNPFNPETIISYSLAEPGHVKLDVYNLIGEKIITLINKEIKAGEYQLSFSAKNLPSGVYFYKLQQNHNLAIKKMLVIK